MNASDKTIDLIINASTGTKTKGRPQYIAYLNSLGIGSEIEELSTPLIKTKGKSKSSTSTEQKLVVKTTASDAEINPWDLAHLANKKIVSSESVVEPDFLQSITIEQKESLITRTKSAPGNFDADWPPKKNTIWHLGDQFSQLKAARDAVSDLNTRTIRIGHLDTGYSKQHPQLPPHIRFEQNFVEVDQVGDAQDRNVGGIQNMPGHGTATITILAGNRYKVPDGSFNDFIGGAPFAEIVPCRISNTVVLLKTSQFAKALHYLLNLHLNDTSIHVVSMSMGGLAAQSWADAVNAAYEAGITIVTASGNNFNGLPTRKLVYPARFSRVLAACGVTYEFSPYFTSKLAEMQGNWGPKRDMSKALAAFTPNTPWASMKNNTISFAGAGTSSATPQIAAAAACYYKKYYDQLEVLPEPWMRVEAIRNALFTSAKKNVRNAKEPYAVYFGNGILQANDALKIPVPSVAELQKIKSEPADVPFFPLFAMIFKARPGRNIVNAGERKMFNIEMMQLVQQHYDLQQILHDEEKTFVELSKKERKEFIEAVIQKRDASRALRNFLQERSKEFLAMPNLIKKARSAKVK